MDPPHLEIAPTGIGTTGEAREAGTSVAQGAGVQDETEETETDMNVTTEGAEMHIGADEKTTGTIGIEMTKGRGMNPTPVESPRAEIKTT